MNTEVEILKRNATKSNDYSNSENKNAKFSQSFYVTFELFYYSLTNVCYSFFVTFMIFVIGSAMKGDWLIILIYLKKQFLENNVSIKTESSPEGIWTMSLKKFHLEGVHTYIVMDLTISYLIYFILGGFLHWWFYVHQRNSPETWKCQPNKWLSPELEKHEIKLGARNVGIGCMIYGTIACYIDNGGYTSLYFSWDEYGWTYLVLSVPMIFLYQDAGSYYIHRWLHVPFMYKRFHKIHHLYKQPTPFSATAMHVVDLLLFEIVLILPMFLFPIHGAIYFINLSYIYYYGVVTHSGINLKSIWPWQADVMFHDNHHQYFHVNYGANFTLWDKIHGTYRCKSKIYNEEIFGGKGKDLSCATKEELHMFQEELKNEIKL